MRRARRPILRTGPWTGLRFDILPTAAVTLAWSAGVAGARRRAAGLRPLLPTLLSYALGFVFLGSLAFLRPLPVCGL